MPLRAIVGVAVTFRVFAATSLALARLLAECFPQLRSDNLCKIYAVWFPFFGMGLTCAPMFLNRSTVLVVAAAVTSVVRLMRAPMLYA